MPGSATLYTEQGVLGHTLGYAPMAEPSSIYVSLCLATTPPSSTTGGTEVVGNGYARQLAVFALSTTPNVAANTATLQYPTATAAWGTIGFFEVWDAINGGNRLYWGPLVDPDDGITPVTRAVLGGDIVRLSAGTIEVQAT